MSTKILLADDHQIVRQGLRALLDQEPDLEVVAETGTGQAAVQLVQELGPDLVIMDLTPEPRTPEVIRQILTQAPGVKIIALSIYTDRRFVVNILRAGASGYMLKDCAFEEMAAAVRAVQENKTYISPGLSGIIVQDYLVALRESEARFRSIFEGAAVGIALVDPDGRIVESNPALERMLGYSQEELRLHLINDFTIPDEGNRCRSLFKELLEGSRESYQVEKQYRRKDGVLGWGRLSVSPFPGPDGEAQFAIGMVQDISEQKRAEQEIATYQERLRSIASELSLTEERERRRLATELHDHVGQILALAQIKLGALRQAASSGNQAPMDEVRRLIEQTIQYTRSLSFELSPPILYDLGFEAAVEWLAELVQEQQGIRVQVRADRAPKPLDDQTRILLFQTVRELLGSMAKNAGAKNVLVTIEKAGTDLLVQVEDDGVALGEAPGPGGPLLGFGLFSIQERLRYFGGRLTVASEPDRGNRVTLVMPLKY